MNVVMALVFVTSAGFANSASDYDQYLLNALKDDNIGIRTSAAKLLGERNVEQAIEPLSKMVKDEAIVSARIVYATALFKIGDSKAYEVLKNVAQYDKNKTVRHIAKSLAREMENKKLAVL
jgi:HEAT repeat protein